MSDNCVKKKEIKEKWKDILDTYTPIYTQKERVIVARTLFIIHLFNQDQSGLREKK